jgi:hypothetical protein
MDIDITIEGPIEPTKENLTEILGKLAERTAESIERFIELEFERSVQLAAFVGQNADPEAVKAIIRGIKANVVPGDPPSVEIEYKDDLSHWYNKGETPPELIEFLNELANTAIEKWFREQERQPILEQVLEEVAK